MKKFKLEQRDNGAIATMPLNHILSILNAGTDENVGKALKAYFGKQLEGAEGTVSDLLQLQSICNWSPENSGITPVEMAKRLGLAGKLVLAEKSKAKDIELTDDDFQVIYGVINNPQYQIRPSSAYWSFLIALQDHFGKSLLEVKKKEESDNENPGPKTT